MGRTSKTGGVEPLGDRIQLTFYLNGKRYRPTLDLQPTKANLAYAARKLEDIRRRIHNGTFSFHDEFPEYRFINRVSSDGAKPTFSRVADDWLGSVQKDLAHATFVSYQKILKSFWRPAIGHRVMADIKYSDLTKALGEGTWTARKTRNNIVSVCRRVFDFAVADKIIAVSPAANLKSMKVQKPMPDPYTVDEAERLIAAMLRWWGKPDANYVEFGFFVGARPSELIAVQWTDIDLERGTMRISKARVMAQDKNTTKTNEVRDVELCPRARAVLTRQKVLYDILKLQGKCRQADGQDHEHVFFKEDGQPYHDLQVQWKRWVAAHRKSGVRYREPYQMRHTSVTWNLMIGKNLLWVAEQHGHSAAVMLKTYAKWLKGSTEADVAEIRRAMEFASSTASRNAVFIGGERGIRTL